MLWGGVTRGTTHIAPQGATQVENRQTLTRSYGRAYWKIQRTGSGMIRQGRCDVLSPNARSLNAFFARPFPS